MRSLIKSTSIWVSCCNALIRSDVIEARISKRFVDSGSCCASGLYPYIIVNGEIPVVVCFALLYENSAVARC